MIRSKNLTSPLLQKDQSFLPFCLMHWWFFFFCLNCPAWNFITYINESLNIPVVEFVIHLPPNHSHSIYVLKSSDVFPHWYMSVELRTSFQDFNSLTFSSIALFFPCTFWVSLPIRSWEASQPPKLAYKIHSVYPYLISPKDEIQ